MGETVGQLTGLLTSEEDSRVVLLALVLFLICTIVIGALIAVLFKMVRNIKEASDLNQQVDRQTLQSSFELSKIAGADIQLFR